MKDHINAHHPIAPNHVTNSSSVENLSSDDSLKASDEHGASRITKDHLNKVRELIERSLREIGRVFISDQDHAALILTALVARGHVLLEGVPGVAKTTLAQAIAHVIGCPMKRIQFTPDLLPADILGGAVFNPQTGEFRTLKGPIFTHILLQPRVQFYNSPRPWELSEYQRPTQIKLITWGNNFPPYEEISEDCVSCRL